jgi:hypothetical protein
MSQHFSPPAGPPRLLGVAGKRAKGSPQSEAPLPPRKTPRGPRQSVVWQGELYWNGGGTSVRLRNISAYGAMVNTSAAIDEGTGAMLALSGGTIACTVVWKGSGAVGIRFDDKIDVTELAFACGRAAPPPEAQPDYVKPPWLASDGDADSPWAARWETLSPDDL